MEKTDYIQLFDKFLQKKATEEEVQMLIQWLKSESSFQDWTVQEWNMASSTIDARLQEKLLQQIKAKICHEKLSVKENKQHSLYSWIMRGVAVITLVLLTGLSVYYYAIGQQVLEDMVVSVEKGQKANIILPDGSKVWVNSDSRLSYGSRFNQKERVLSLEGEAYFEVMPDKDRPFIVKTKEMAIRALGTSFNVKSYEIERDASAVLKTGKVEITTDLDRFVLNPNERIVFDKQTRHIQKSYVDNAANYINWKYNKLTFSGETFESIAHTLERYYNTQIIFESESLKKYRFTGTPGNTSLESILQILSLTSPLTYEVKDSAIVLRENMKQKAYYEKALK